MTLHYRMGGLYCDDVTLQSIASQTGTPLYVYSLIQIRANYRRVKAAFESLDPTIYFSLKANGNLAVLQTLREEGSSFDAVSGGEIFRALAAGADPASLVFAGAGKTRAELDYALEQRVGCFNVESTGELERLSRLATERGQVADVALRLNPHVQAQTHRYIATGHAAAKFGMSEGEIRQVLGHAERYPALRLCGLHVHIGSQLGSVEETVEAARYALGIIDDFPQLTRLNMGGGFPVPYAGEDYPSVEAFAQALGTVLNGRPVALSLEPGRYVVADAGALVVEIQYVKQVDGVRFLVTDGGMTELIRPALYGAIHPILPLRAAAGPLSSAQVVGPVCESSDILNANAELPELEAGDLLAVTMVGAYGASMGSNYNARPRPPEVIIDGASWRIARRRESLSDLIRLET